MEQTKLLKWIVGILLVVNLITISLAWFGSFFPEPAHHRGKAATFLSKELGFSAEQEKKYAQLREKHQHDTKICNEKGMVFRKQLYALLAENSQSSSINTLLDSVGFYSRKAEQVRFEHFQEVRAICDEKQKTRLGQVMQEVIRMMSPPPPPKKH